MNQNSIISKFIEKCGELDPKPNYHYAEGSKLRRYGLTTEPRTVLQFWRERFYRDHQEYHKWFYEFDEKDLLQAMRFLQNSPFSKIQVVHSTEPLPMIFTRKDVDVAILLAPMMLELPKVEDQAIQKSHFKGNPWRDGKPEYYWTQQLPNSTFWIVKCRNCHTEMTIQDWTNKLTTMNHPECQCSCDTYDDFCGCRRRREMAQFDRIRRQSTIRKHFMRNHWDMA